MIIGAGGVAHVAAHKAAMHNDVLGDICIASRTLPKCDEIIASIHAMGHLKNKSGKLYSRQLDALDIPATVKLIRETKSEIVLNLGNAFVNMSILEACLETGAVYLDTAIHEDPDKVCEQPPWYANYEWKRKDRCAEKGLTAILGVGFDPGVVNAYCALAKKKYFDKIDTIDILDVNAGSHGRYFATNFDPEINFREFIKVWTWIDRQWKEYPTHSVKRTYNFPVVGDCPIYLNGHDELHSLSKNIDANSIRFWMGFGDHYINVFTVLRTLGFLNHLPVTLSTGQEVVPLKVVKLVLVTLLRAPKTAKLGRCSFTKYPITKPVTKKSVPKASVIPQVCLPSLRPFWWLRERGIHKRWLMWKNSIPNLSSLCSIKSACRRILKKLHPTVPALSAVKFAI